MKRTLIPALAVLSLFGSGLPGRCDLIKAGTTYHRDFLAYDTGGNNLTASAASTFTVQQSVAGAAPVTITPTITYKGAGHFDLVYTPALDATPGSSALIITAPGATQVDINDQIVGFDPASDLGAAALATANTGIGTANTSLASISARPAQTGDTFGLLSPLIASGKFTANALSLALTGSGGTVTVGGYATGQDPATLLAAGVKVSGFTPAALLAEEQGIFGYTLAGITFGDHVVNTAEVVTGGFSVTHPDSAHQTTAYSLGGVNHVTTSLTTSAGAPVSRTTTLANQ